MVSKDTAAPETQSTEIATTRTFDTETLRALTSYDEALNALNDVGVPIRDASEFLGDGFELLDDKDKAQLVGVPLVVLEASESPGDYGKTFVSLRIMTRDGRKVIVNDGSTGIRDQVVQMIGAHGTAAGLRVSHGFRASTYAFCEECKAINKSGASACSQCSHSPLSPAATYYLDTSK